MKCPRCQKENPDGVKFCTGCGLPLAPVRHHGGSRAGRAIVGVLKTFCYVFLMLGVQYIVSSVFASYAMLSDSSMLYSFNFDYEDMARRITELLFENITMLTLVANLITILVLSLFFTLRKKNPVEEVMIRPVKRGKSIIPLCILYGTALNIFISVTLSIIPLPESLLEALDNQYASLYGQTNLLIEILNTAVITGFLEEVIFRGLALSRLKRGMSRGAAVIVSALIFGVFHGAFIAIVYATVLGIVFALLAERYDSIVPTIFCHVFFNLTSYWFVTENTFVILALYFASIAVLIFGSYLLFKGNHADGEKKMEEINKQVP